MRTWKKVVCWSRVCEGGRDGWGEREGVESVREEKLYGVYVWNGVKRLHMHVVCVYVCVYVLVEWEAE